MTKIHFISIHGFRGKPDLDYHKYIQNSLGKLGYEVEIPTLPNPENPREEDQIEAVLQQCHLDKNTIIIAHSLGCAVAMKLLMRLPFTIKGLLLVAPVVEPAFCIPEHAALSYWNGFTFNYDYELIKIKVSKRLILSDLSEYDVRGKYCEYLSGKIDAELKEVTARRRHLTGYEEPDVLSAAESFLV